MHPHSGAFLTTAWEGELLYGVGVELAHQWGVPTLAGVYGTDAPAPGWQAAEESATALMLCVLAGAETGSGMGLLDTCTLLYPEQLVLDSDIYQRVRFDAQGLDTSPSGLALDIIKGVGPRGQFLRHRHTRDNLRRRAYSDLTGQATPAGDLRDPLEVAREKAEGILKHHRPEPLPESKRKELKRILSEAEKEFG
jgi:trimethylamine--corrinoid protein Co-methyltransferase